MTYNDTTHCWMYNINPETEALLQMLVKLGLFQQGTTVNMRYTGGTTTYNTMTDFTTTYDN